MANAATDIYVEQWLLSRLISDSAVSAVCDNRVYPVFVPALENLPAVTYRRRNTARGQHARGSTGDPQASFELTAWGFDYRELLIAAKAILDCLDGVQIEEGGHKIRQVAVEDEYDAAEPPDWAGEEWLLGRTLVLRIKYRETIPSNITAPGQA